MKKCFPILLLITAVTFTSCKKEYTCTCTTTFTATHTVKSTAVYPISRTSGKHAREQCAAHQTSATLGGSTTSISCRL